MIKRISFEDKEKSSSIYSNLIMTADDTNEIKHVINSLVDYANAHVASTKTTFKYAEITIPIDLNFRYAYDFILELADNISFLNKQTISISKRNANFKLLSSDGAWVDCYDLIRSKDVGKTLLVDIEDYLNERHVMFARCKFTASLDKREFQTFAIGVNVPDQPSQNVPVAFTFSSNNEAALNAAKHLDKDILSKLVLEPINVDSSSIDFSSFKTVLKFNEKPMMDMSGCELISNWLYDVTEKTEYSLKAEGNEITITAVTTINRKSYISRCYAKMPDSAKLSEVSLLKCMLNKNETVNLSSYIRFSGNDGSEMTGLQYSLSSNNNALIEVNGKKIKAKNYSGCSSVNLISDHCDKEFPILVGDGAYVMFSVELNEIAPGKKFRYELLGADDDQVSIDIYCPDAAFSIDRNERTIEVVHAAKDITAVFEFRFSTVRLLKTAEIFSTEIDKLDTDIPNEICYNDGMTNYSVSGFIKDKLVDATNSTKIEDGVLLRFFNNKVMTVKNGFGADIAESIKLKNGDAELIKIVNAKADPTVVKLEICPSPAYDQFSADDVVTLIASAYYSDGSVKDATAGTRFKLNPSIDSLSKNILTIR